MYVYRYFLMQHLRFYSLLILLGNREHTIHVRDCKRISQLRKIPTSVLRMFEGVNQSKHRIFITNNNERIQGTVHAC